MFYYFAKIRQLPLYRKTFFTLLFPLILSFLDDDIVAILRYEWSRLLVILRITLLFR